jgi:hypothetical protein
MPPEPIASRMDLDEHKVTPLTSHTLTVTARIVLLTLLEISAVQLNSDQPAAPYVLYRNKEFQYEVKRGQSN